MQGIDGDYFIHFGLERFWIEASLPQNILKKSLDKHLSCDPFRVPLALTLLRKNQKAPLRGTVGRAKWIMGRNVMENVGVTCRGKWTSDQKTLVIANEEDGSPYLEIEAKGVTDKGKCRKCSRTYNIPTSYEDYALSNTRMFCQIETE